MPMVKRRQHRRRGPDPRVVWGAIALGLALVLGLVVAMNWPLSEARKAELRLEMTDASPTVRLRAAERLLENTPSDSEALRIAVEALLEMRRPLMAREMLGRYGQGDIAYRSLLARVYVLEAEAYVDSLSVSAMTMTEPAAYLEQMFEQVERLKLALLAEDHPVEVAALTVSQYSIRLSLARQLLSLAETERFRVELVSDDTEDHSEAGARVGQLRVEVSDLQRRLEDALAELETLDPEHSLPALVRFSTAMDRGAMGEAIEIVRKVSERSRIDRAVAGEMAISLLRSEARYAQPRTRSQLELARTLIEHPGLEGPDRAGLIIAAWKLATEGGDFEEALALARDLEKLRHPEAIPLVARSLAAKGEAERAILLLQDVLTRANEELDLRFALAEAYASRGDDAQALIQYRRVLQVRENHLPALLQIARINDRAGTLIGASEAIETAYAISPRHPEVIMFWARLLVETDAHDRITGQIWRYFKEHGQIRPESLDLLAAIIDDDTERANREIAAGLSENPRDVFLQIIKGWTLTDRDRRAYLTTLIAQSVVDVLAADPLARWSSPRSPVITWTQRLTRPVTELDLRPNPAYLRFSRFAYGPTEFLADALELALQQGTVDRRVVERAIEAAFVTERNELLDMALAMADDGHSPLGRVIACIHQERWHEGRIAFDELDVPWRSRLAGRVAELRLLLHEERMDAAAARVLIDLEQVAWPFETLAEIIEHMIAQRHLDESRQLLREARRHNPRLVTLIECRALLAQGKPREVLERIEVPARDERENLQFRRWASDLVASAHLQAGDVNAGLIPLDRLWNRRAEHEQASRLATVDVHIEANARTSAINSIGAIVHHGRQPARWLDETLIRARLMLPPEQLLSMLDDLMISRENDRVVLRWWRAVVLGDMERWEEAANVVEDVLEKRPDSPRALRLAAQIYSELEQLDRAEAAMNRAQSMGGLIALLAREQKSRWAGRRDQAPTESPDPQIGLER
ncbi:MAG: tetratricopeptide repeat protein [Phycisphaeraceae bacterium]|nr:tetratricopeptide repeat protein [Phycisphaeraceae bacterium]